MGLCPACGGRLLGSEGVCSHCGSPLKASVYLEERGCANEKCKKMFQALDVDSVREVSRITRLPNWLFDYCPQCFERIRGRGYTLIRHMEVWIAQEYGFSRPEKLFLKKCLNVLKKRQ